MAGLKTATGEAIDGSFELQVRVDDGFAVGQPCPIASAGPTAGPTAAPQVVTLRVSGELHVGGLMLLIAESAGRRQDWSDHGLWWQQRGQWLLRPGRCLDALGVGGAAGLLFTPRHRPLRLLLGTRRRLRLRLDCARPAARAVGQACALLGVPHPEELSLLRGGEEEEEEGGGSWWGGGAARRKRGPPPPPDWDHSHVRPGEEGAWPEPLPPEALRLLLTPGEGFVPPSPPRGNPLQRRARLHSRWLDPSRSLLEQGVGDDEELLLLFKFHCYLDLDPQVDSARLGLLVAQGRRSLLTEEVDCTEEEALLLGALQYLMDEGGPSSDPRGGPDPDDLETALSNLEVTLGGGTQSSGPLEDLTAAPELVEELELCRAPRRPLPRFRPARLQLRDSTLSFGPPGDPPTQINLRGCEVTPEAEPGGQKFQLQLLVAAPEGMNRLLLRCRDAAQYSRWVAGCRLASQGRSLGAIGEEAKGVLGVLGLLPGAPGDPSLPPNSSRPPPDPRLLLPPRFLRKGRAKQLSGRLLLTLQRLGALPPPQARGRFLEAWRALPGFGLAYFIVRVQGSRRDEGLAVGPSRLLQLELGSGSVSRVWRFSDLRQWNVNWDSQQVTLELSGQRALALRVLSAPCGTLHRFLGGYLALGGAPGGRRDPRLLQQLTGGGGADEEEP